MAEQKMSLEKAIAEAEKFADFYLRQVEVLSVARDAEAAGERKEQIESEIEALNKKLAALNQEFEKKRAANNETLRKQESQITANNIELAEHSKRMEEI